MKTKVQAGLLIFTLITGLLFTGCRKDAPEPYTAPRGDTISKTNVVNSFIWNGLHDFYLWADQVPELSNRKYKNSDSLNLFLNNYTDPQVLFESLLYKYNVVDKWSFMVEESNVIDDWISGTSKTMGFDFDLRRYENDNVLGFVRYVLPNSPAKAAGLRRGDIFIKVNNQQLTVSNYISLFINSESYNLGFAAISDGAISENGKTSPTMNAIVLQENPIHMDTTFMVGIQKIGYLVYNGFNSDFDLQLNNVFNKFKDAQIDKLILDLRYNGGGSVQTCIYLASMIYSTNDKQVFAQSQYNNYLESYLVDLYGESALYDYFTPTMFATEVNPAIIINSLNLQSIYFIVSDNTASASELLINGLRPYMNVKVIGTNTVGKYTGSTTLKDYDENGNINPKNNYAMQPIVVKYANSLGVSDFVGGLIPDIYAKEDIASLLPFGNPNEKLLSYVIADIKGMPVVAQSLKSAGIGLNKITDSQSLKPFGTDMYIDQIKVQKSLKMQ
jgi:C-terminal processing protease CtpA/Prc